MSNVIVWGRHEPHWVWDGEKLWMTHNGGRSPFYRDHSREDEGPAAIIRLVDSLEPRLKWDIWRLPEAVRGYDPVMNVPEGL